MPRSSRRARLSRGKRRVPNMWITALEPDWSFLNVHFFQTPKGLGSRLVGGQPKKDHRLVQENPYLEGCGCLKVPPEAAARAAELCKQQLAVCVAAEEGVFDCSGVQVGALLDALFAYDGPLGCQVSDGVELRLWAPTALSVEVMLYDKPRKDAGTSHPMSLQGEGVWLLQGPKKWLGKYYTYKVQAYHPTTGRVEVMETPDPYCSACSADAGRSLICELPPMPQQPAMPPFRHRAKATIYELHVRDFSARDSSVDKAGVSAWPFARGIGRGLP